MEDQNLKPVEPVQDKKVNKPRPGLPKFIIIGIILLILFAIVYSLYYFFINAQNDTSHDVIPTPTITEDINTDALFNLVSSENGTSTIDPKTKWKTYTDEELGFKISSPLDYCLPSDYMDCYEHAQLSIFRMDNPKNLNSENFVNEYLQKTYPKVKSFTKKNVTIDNTPAIEVLDMPTGPTAEQTNFFVAKDKYVYNFQFIAFHSELSDVFYDILPTIEIFSTITPTPHEIYDPPPTDEAFFCTMDAKLCPDGSSVGRQGPNCEFAPCPGN